MDISLWQLLVVLILIVLLILRARLSTRYVCRRETDMVEKIVVRRHLEDSSCKVDLDYWRSRTDRERIAAVDFLRRQQHGHLPGLRRVVRVVERT